MSRVLKPKLTIENLNFEQYCQTRPRRWIPKSAEEVKVVDAEGVKGKFCEVGGGACKEPAVTVGVYLPTKKEYRLCSKHGNLFAETSSWRVH